MTYLKLHTPLFGEKKISSNTLTMGVMCAAIPMSGVSLYQTAWPDPRAASEATLSSEGTVGCFNKFGTSRGLFKNGKFNRLVCV